MTEPIIRLDIGAPYPARDFPLDQAIRIGYQLQREGQPERAAKVWKAVLAGAPHQFDALLMIGVEFMHAPDVKSAKGFFSRAVKADPNRADGHVNLAAAERQLGNLGAAERALRTAIRLEPKLAEAHNALGVLLQQRKRYADALAAYDLAIQLDDTLVEAKLNHAALQLELGQGVDTGKMIDRLKLDLSQPSIKPTLAGGNIRVKRTDNSAAKYKVLAALVLQSGRIEEAESILNEAIRENPDDAESHYQLGSALEELGRWDTALEHVDRSLELRPGYGPALSDASYLRRRLCQWDDLEAASAALIDAASAGVSGIKPFPMLSEPVSPALQLQVAERFAQDIETRVVDYRYKLTGEVAQRDGRLRVGYMSNGFQRHPTGLLTVELFENHDQDKVLPIVYSLGSDDGSSWRARIQRSAYQYRDLSAVAPQAVAARIQADDIDILVDLRGYGGGGLPEVFARRPAPVQVNWLAYPGTTGASWMDAVIADAFVMPDSLAQNYSEKPVFLPRAFQPADTQRKVANPPSRAACGLPESGFVFCSFNNSYKITPDVFAVWMEILRAVPDSVLWLLDSPPGTSTKQNLRAEAQSLGIDENRLIFMAKLPNDEYLSRYRHADLFLDTAPYNAHTTAGDALYAGCPVLTCPGETFASRVAGSLVHHLGLADQLICSDWSGYQANAVDFAKRPDRLETARATLAANRDEHFDMVAFTRDFEDCLRGLASSADDRQ